MVIDGNECGDNQKGYWVYYGMGSAGKVSLVGTTKGRPSDKFKWHERNGQELKFKAIKKFGSVEDMLAYQKNAIVRLKPSLNTRPYRTGANRKLSEKYVKMRTDNDDWCQECLRCRVSSGYRKCVWCML